MQRSLVLCIAIALTASLVLAESAAYDQYGGWKKLRGKKTGYFHTQQIRGRWWLVTPDGYVFFSKGVCHVAFSREASSSPAEPSDRAAWSKATAQQLKGWNFNTVGNWSYPEMFKTGLAYAPAINIAGTAARDARAEGLIPDYFSPEFRETADRVAKQMCAARARDPWLLGYFTDNELAWTHNEIAWSPNPPWNLPESLLGLYLKMPEQSAGRRKANQYMKTRGLIEGTLTEDDKNGFAEVVATEYARVCRDAIRRYDPNHMILGCRFAGHAPEPILRGIAPYVDVVSFNNYHPRPPLWKLQQLTDVTGKPIMITEFSFKAMDSGLPNTLGAAAPVATQQDRADGFDQYVRDLAALPSCVGYHWFEYRDEPKEGRGGDGENSNYGLVKIDGALWEVLTTRMTQVNSEIESLAAKAAKRP
jgi:agarase